MKSYKEFLNDKKDVVVTIPKSEYKNDDLETDKMKKEGLTQFWNFKKLPKNLGIGSKIYFVKNGEVESYMVVFKIDQKTSEQCSTTGRNWEGNIVHMKNLVYLDKKIPCKGFQGYRYKWWV